MAKSQETQKNEWRNAFSLGVVSLRKKECRARHNTQTNVPFSVMGL
jgi:hypothetical protein